MQEEQRGLLLGLAGVMSFSLTLPATQVAVDYFGPPTVGLGRAALASLLAGVWLAARRRPLPRGKQLRAIGVVAAGAILGFPLLSAWAMARLPSSHGAVILGLLPLATAGVASLRGGERPSLTFWLSTAIGAAVVILFALSQEEGGLALPDLALVGAVAAAAVAYAEGGRLAREMAGLDVISWALVLSLPITLIPAALVWPTEAWSSPPPAWVAFGYVSLVSQFLGFGLWYRGLALGGIASVGQLQLLQPFLTIMASAALLGEPITLGTLTAATLVLLAVAIGRRSSGPAAKVPRSSTNASRSPTD